MKYYAKVDMDKRDFDNYNRLLAISNLEEMTEEDRAIGAREDDFIPVFAVDFEDGAELTFDICSGCNNYFDNVVLWTEGFETYCPDCAYAVEKVIEIEYNDKTYIVEINLI